MKRVSKEVLSPLGVSAISCRAQLGQGCKGRQERTMVSIYCPCEAQSRQGGPRSSTQGNCAWSLLPSTLEHGGQPVSL